MRVAINLLSEDPQNPSGAHWFWTRLIPEMAKRLDADEQLHLLVSPSSRGGYAGYGPSVHYITFPWSNERRNLRTLSEHLYSPLRLPWDRIDVLNTLMAPIVNPTWSLVVHMKTMHAFTAPGSVAWPARLYRRLNYPRSARLANAIIVNSQSMRAEVEHYLQVDPKKLHVIYEAVDHELFRPAEGEARPHLASFGVTRPFVLFVSSLWRYKNCEGLLRAWVRARVDAPGRQLVIVGSRRDVDYSNELDALVVELGIADDVIFVGGVALEETARFYQAADAFVYPSFSETFGLPLLEAMACGCPVVTSDVSSMPEIAGGAAVLVDPHDPGSIAAGIVEAVGPRRADLREQGLRRAAMFNWGLTAEGTLSVYREAARQRRRRLSR